MTDAKNRGEIARDWWRERLANRDSGAARGLMARIRRATALEALMEPAVQDLRRMLGLGTSAGEVAALVRLVQVLAEVREAGEPLARRLGGDPPVLSSLRFQRILRAEGDEATAALRRAVIMAERRCDVGRLATDLLAWDHPDWGEAVRRRWIFDYFAAPTPEADKTPEETVS